MLLLLAVAGAAHAQTAVTPPANAPAATAPSADELKKLVDTLNDPAQRQHLIEQLRALIAAQNEGRPAEAAPETVFDQLSLQIDAITGEILATAQMAVDAPRLVHWFEGQAENDEARTFWAAVALRLAFIFGIGFVADRVVWLLLRGVQKKLAAAPGVSAGARLFLLLLAMVIEALPPIAFAVAASLTVPFTQPSYGTRQDAHVLIGAILWTRIVFAVARIALLAPAAQALYPLGEETRQYLYIWVRRFTGWIVYGYAVASAAWWLGVPGAVYALILRGTILMLTILAVVFVLQNRRGVADWLRGTPGGPSSSWRVLRSRLAETWHVLAIIYVVGSFGVYVLRIGSGYLFLLRATVLTVVVLLAGALIVRFVERVSERGFAVSPEVKLRYPTLEARANRYLPVLFYITAAVVYVFAALAVLQAWGVNAFAWLDTDTGRRATGMLVTVGVVLAVALIVWELFSSAIERYLHAGPEAGRSARIRTLLPVMRTIGLIVIVTLVALTLLSEIGVNIAPLLAGAGVVGLAIGFASQALLKDLIIGLIILAEDSLAVGEVVDVGKGVGVVENITMRAMRLRDQSGTLLTIPFSEVTTIKNMTRDYAYSVHDVSVLFREDPDHAIAVLRAAAAEMIADKEWAARVSGPLDVIGLEHFSDSAQVIRVRLRTAPLQQWAVHYELNRRIKKAFDAAGIEMPAANQTRYLEEKKPEASPVVPAKTGTTA